LELETSGEDRVIVGLAPVASNRGQLDGTGDLDVERPVAVQGNERRGELGVEPGSDIGGDAPLQDGQPVPIGNAERGSGRCPMVGMTGDAVGVEDEKPVSRDLFGEVEDVGGQVVHVDLGQCAVGARPR